jgi:hypothetical protein
MPLRRCLYRSHDPAAARQLHDLEFGSVLPRLELACQEQAAAGSGQSAMWDLASASQFVDDAAAAAQPLRDLLSRENGERASSGRCRSDEVDRSSPRMP